MAKDLVSRVVSESSKVDAIRSKALKCGAVGVCTRSAITGANQTETIAEFKKAADKKKFDKIVKL